MVAEKRVHGVVLRIQEGDITEVAADAIVNAANNHLWMGGGVAGAIKRKGGVEIEQEAVAKGPIPVGEAVVTGAGRLPARYCIHAAVMGQDLKTDGGKIAKATESSLRRATELGIRSIAFPALGTGVGGFPFDLAGEIMLKTTVEFLKSEKTSLEEVTFVLFGEEAYNAFAKALERLEV